MSAVQTELPGARVLDLYAGSGALGLEALSRGASHATFVERSGGALRVLRANVDRLGAGSTTAVVRSDALAYVRDLDEHAFDLAFADPPYGQGHADALARRFVERPFARTLWIEHRVDDPVPEPPGARTRRYGDTALTSIPGGT